MRALPLILIAGVVIALLVVINSFYVVRQDQQAIVLQFGDPVAVRNVEGTEADEAGLYFKMPFVQDVIILDRKNLGLDIADIQVLASDQRRLVVDSFVRWRISDPLEFYTSLRSEAGAAEQIRSVTESAIRETLGDVPVPEIISGQRATLMNRIRDSANTRLAAAGIEIIDVRILQADLPQEIADGIYVRMQTARRQEAERIRSEGEEAALLIRATAQREATVIEARAQEQSQIIRGDADAQRTAIYTDVHSQDPEFYRFYRSLEACEQSIQAGTRIIVGPNNLAICDVFSAEAARSSSGNR